MFLMILSVNLIKKVTDKNKKITDRNFVSNFYLFSRFKKTSFKLIVFYKNTDTTVVIKLFKQF